MKLSEKQELIVKHVDGPILVKAGPGSGKTRVIIERIKYLLKTKKRGKILALTFSNMAAIEMQSRLENDPTVGEAVSRVSMSKIHSFCLDVVQSRGYLIGLQSDISLFESENDRASIMRNLFLEEPELRSIYKRNSSPDAFIAKMLSKISEQKRGLISPESCTEEAPFPVIYQKYNEALRLQNAMDFDDILFYAYQIFTENISVSNLYTSVYSHICIDEAQDLNNVQYRVIQALCGEKFSNIMMVGDENQSIYAFNGSSSKYMKDLFVADYGPTIYTLDENFRSAKEIIRFANSLTNNKENITTYHYEGELKITAYENEKEEACAVIKKIKSLLNKEHQEVEGVLQYDNFAVIARNRYVFNKIEEEFREANIPFYFKKSKSGIECETDYMIAFDLLLRLIMNPRDLFHWNSLKMLVSGKESSDSFSKITSVEIEQLLSENKFSWLSSIPSMITNEHVLEFDKIIVFLKRNVSENLINEERYLLEKDIAEWQSHWNRYKKMVAREHRFLQSFRNSISLGKTQDSEGDSGVALLTAHMSKGLEFEVVFIVGLTEGTFPDYRAVREKGDAINQEKNNMYVAVTRAKRLCFLSYPKSKLMPWGDKAKQSASRFIEKYDTGKNTQTSDARHI